MNSFGSSKYTNKILMLHKRSVLNNIAIYIFFCLADLCFYLGNDVFGMLTFCSEIQTTTLDI